MTIRVRQTDNLSCVEKFGQAMCDEIGLPETFRQDVLQQLLGANLRMGNCVFFVSENEQEITGGICGLITPSWVSGNLEAHEVFWYVSPPYRTTRSGLLLFRAWQTWAKEHKAKRIFNSHFMNNMNLGEFFERQGYKKFQHSYWKEL